MAKKARLRPGFVFFSQELMHELRDDLACQPVVFHVEFAFYLAWLEIQLDRTGSADTRFVNKSGGRIYMTGRANRHEEISSGQRIVDFIHTQRHFAKPHNVRAQRCRELTAVTA